MSIRILNHKAVRKMALDSCKEFGIPATVVRKGFIRSLESSVRIFITQQAISSVQDGKKTITAPPL